MKVSSPSLLRNQTNPYSLRDWLQGDWQLTRETDDHINDQRYRFAGASQFLASQDGLIQHDKGMLSLENGQAFQAEQRYLWQFSAEQILIKFTDNRLFLTLSPPFTLCDSQHLCGQDDYVARFEFLSNTEWYVRFQVNGPRKNYVMTSHYARAAHKLG